MIYLIGGAFRIGKTTLAKRILKEEGIPYISTDILRNSLYKFLGRDFPKKWVDRPAEFWPYLSDFIKRAKSKYADGLVIEGDIFLPEQISGILDDNIRCCFVGSSNITLDQIKHDSPDNWVNTQTPEEQAYLPQSIMDISKMIKDDAEKYGFKYFDVAQGRESALNAAYNYLFE